MNKFDFNKVVYDIVKEIPFGKVLTYGQIARLAGKPQCSRMVGQAMHNVPANECIPCHRVVNSTGRLAPGWLDQRKLLESEGVVFKKNGCIDIRSYRWEEATL